MFHCFDWWQIFHLNVGLSAIVVSSTFLLELVLFFFLSHWKCATAGHCLFFIWFCPFPILIISLPGDTVRWPGTSLWLKSGLPIEILKWIGNQFIYVFGNFQAVKYSNVWQSYLSGAEARIPWEDLVVEKSIFLVV